MLHTMLFGDLQCIEYNGKLQCMVVYEKSYKNTLNLDGERMQPREVGISDGSYKI